MPRTGKEASAATPLLSVGFLLLPNFTLLPFAAFIDALRLAADEGDQSRQINCTWTVMADSLESVRSSCNVSVQPWEVLREPEGFDYIVVVGGLLHGGPTLSPSVRDFLRDAASKHVTLVGLCTGSFALVRAGLMSGRRCCVSWFHYRDLLDEYSDVIPVADQLYVDDGDRITCAGGAAAADVAAAIIERHLGRRWARKSLRIMLMDSPRPANSPQPQPSSDVTVHNQRVKKALLIMEQNMSQPLSTDEIAERVNLSKRQLERLFGRETGLSLQRYYRSIRLRYGMWLLKHSNRSIAQISDECGFADLGHFQRAFRETFNQTAAEFRRIALGG